MPTKSLWEEIQMLHSVQHKVEIIDLKCAICNAGCGAVGPTECS
jgi:hypothetical protein